MSFRSGLLLCFKASILTKFCLFALSVIEKCVEISQYDNVLISPCSSVNFVLYIRLLLTNLELLYFLRELKYF